MLGRVPGIQTQLGEWEHMHIRSEDKNTIDLAFEDDIDFYSIELGDRDSEEPCLDDTGTVVDNFDIELCVEQAQHKTGMKGDTTISYLTFLTVGIKHERKLGFRNLCVGNVSKNLKQYD